MHLKKHLLRITSLMKQYLNAMRKKCKISDLLLVYILVNLTQCTQT